MEILYEIKKYSGRRRSDRQQPLLCAGCRFPCRKLAIYFSAETATPYRDRYGKRSIYHGHGKGTPDINYLGIEKYTSVLLRAVQKMEAEESPIDSLRFLCFNAEDIAEIFAPGEVDRIYLNFSDPWPKDRHAKRRLTSSAFLDRYDKILKKGGHIEFKTDNRDLFDFSVEEIENSSIWQIDAKTYDLHQDASMNAGNIMTEYEEKFSSKGNPICKLIASRIDD